MHTLLEAYLDQVAAHLSALPPKRRKEELREMRQHLLNAVTVNRELGQSEEDAAVNAVMQFGTPEDLGDNLVWAWRRERTLNQKSFFGAAVTTPLMVCIGFLFMNFGFGFLIHALPPDCLHWLDQYNVQHPNFSSALVRGTSLLTFGGGRIGRRHTISEAGDARYRSRSRVVLDRVGCCRRNWTTANPC